MKATISALISGLLAITAFFVSTLCGETGSLLAQDANAVKEPIHIVLVVDTSGSMREHIATISTSLDEFINFGIARNLECRVTLVSFNSEAARGRSIRVGRLEQRDLINEIKSLPIQGSTFIYGGLKEAFELLQPDREHKNRQYIVLFTDENDQPPAGKPRLNGVEQQLNAFAEQKGLKPREDYFVLFAAMKPEIKPELQQSITRLHGDSRFIKELTWGSFEINPQELRLHEAVSTPARQVQTHDFRIQPRNVKNGWGNFRLSGAPAGVNCYVATELEYKGKPYYFVLDALQGGSVVCISHTAGSAQLGKPVTYQLADFGNASQQRIRNLAAAVNAMPETQRSMSSTFALNADEAQSLQKLKLVTIIDFTSSEMTDGDHDFNLEFDSPGQLVIPQPDSIQLTLPVIRPVVKVSQQELKLPTVSADDPESSKVFQLTPNKSVIFEAEGASVSAYFRLRNDAPIPPGVKLKLGPANHAVELKPVQGTSRLLTTYSTAEWKNGIELQLKIDDKVPPGTYEGEIAFRFNTNSLVLFDYGKSPGNEELKAIRVVIEVAKATVPVVSFSHDLVAFERMSLNDLREFELVLKPNEKARKVAGEGDIPLTASFAWDDTPSDPSPAQLSFTANWGNGTDVELNPDAHLEIADLFPDAQAEVNKLVLRMKLTRHGSAAQMRTGTLTLSTTHAKLKLDPATIKITFNSHEPPSFKLAATSSTNPLSMQFADVAPLQRSTQFARLTPDEESLLLDNQTTKADFTLTFRNAPPYLQLRADPAVKQFTWDPASGVATGVIDNIAQAEGVPFQLTATIQDNQVIKREVVTGELALRFNDTQIKPVEPLDVEVAILPWVRLGDVFIPGVNVAQVEKGDTFELNLPVDASLAGTDVSIALDTGDGILRAKGTTEKGPELSLFPAAVASGSSSSEAITGNSPLQVSAGDTSIALSAKLTNVREEGSWEFDVPVSVVDGTCLVDRSRIKITVDVVKDEWMIRPPRHLTLDTRLWRFRKFIVVENFDKEATYTVRYRFDCPHLQWKSANLEGSCAVLATRTPPGVVISETELPISFEGLSLPEGQEVEGEVTFWVEQDGNEIWQTDAPRKVSFVAARLQTPQLKLGALGSERSVQTKPNRDSRQRAGMSYTVAAEDNEPLPLTASSAVQPLADRELKQRRVFVVLPGYPRLETIGDGQLISELKKHAKEGTDGQASLYFKELPPNEISQPIDTDKFVEVPSIWNWCLYPTSASVTKYLLADMAAFGDPAVANGDVANENLNTYLGEGEVEVWRIAELDVTTPGSWGVLIWLIPSVIAGVLALAAMIGFGIALQGQRDSLDQLGFNEWANAIYVFDSTTPRGAFNPQHGPGKGAFIEKGESTPPSYSPSVGALAGVGAVLTPFPERWMTYTPASGKQIHVGIRETQSGCEIAVVPGKRGSVTTKVNGRNLDSGWNELISWSDSKGPTTTRLREGGGPPAKIVIERQEGNIEFVMQHKRLVAHNETATKDSVGWNRLGCQLIGNSWLIPAAVLVIGCAYTFWQVIQRVYM